MTADTRQQVRAEIIRVIAEAQASGRDGIAVAKATFPGLPETVLWECWTDVEHAQTEAWWQAVERTIDGELIRNAVAKVSPDAKAP